MRGGGWYNGAMKWVSPIAHNDPSEFWLGETEAYDGDITTYAFTSLASDSWGGWLELMRVLYSNTLRIRVSLSPVGRNINTIQIEVDFGGWIPVYTGVFPVDVWREFVFNQGIIKGARLRFYRGASVGLAYVRLHELEFNQVEGRGIDALVGESYKPRVAKLGEYGPREPLG